MRYSKKCPVCGRYTFKEKYDICPVCSWENDPLQLKDPNFKGGANAMCLNDAKHFFDVGYEIALEENESEE